MQQRLSFSVSSPPKLYRGFSASKFLKSRGNTEVPVASYTKSKKSGTGTAERTTLKVDGSKPATTPVSSEDVDREAVAFNKSIVPKMTPTMKRFTLEGKVAVVTG